MLAPITRSRAALGSALLLTACAGSVVLASGASSAPTAAGSGATTYGPVAAAPAARPLVDLTSPLLGAAGTAPLIRTPPALGPRAGAARVGPPGVVGPGSPPARVREVQRLLNRRGAGLRVDGAWGPATTRRVAALQAAHGLPMDGRAGPLTLALLRS